jgi:hypothetical protein
MNDFERSLDRILETMCFMKTVRALCYCMLAAKTVGCMQYAGAITVTVAMPFKLFFRNI